MRPVEGSDADELAGLSAKAHPRPLLVKRLRYGIIIPILLYVVLVASGLTMSSLGVDSLRQDPANPLGLTIGEDRGLRVDEWGKATPVILGVIAAGGAVEASPLFADPDLLIRVSNDTLIDSLVFFDAAILRLGRWLPDSDVFSAYYWLPILLFLIYSPMLLQRLGATVRHSWFGTTLGLFCPVVFWWSFIPINILGFLIPGLYFLTAAIGLAKAKQSWQSALCIALSSILIIRPVTTYVPWFIVLGIPLVLSVVIWALWPAPQRRVAVFTVGIVGILSLLMLGGLVWSNWDAVQSQAGTVYPGQRRTTGLLQSANLLFGAPIGFAVEGGTETLGTNLSEISSGFTVCLVWVLLMHAFGGRKERSARWAVQMSMTGCTLFWFLWSSLSWGGIGASIPILNQIEPRRAAATVGLLAVFSVSLALSDWTARSARTPLIMAGIATWVTGYGASSLQLITNPPIRSWQILLAMFSVGGIVYFASRYPKNWQPLVAASIGSFLAVVAVNPITFGLGDLRDSQSAQQMSAAGITARANGGRWASDSFYVDGLLISSGVPTLSGIQFAGPNESQWAKLDPDGQYRDAWNRGASVVAFGWTSDPQIRIENPATVDWISVYANPCVIATLDLGLTNIVSSSQLTQPCLAAQGTFQWGGSTQYIYALQK